MGPHKSTCIKYTKVPYLDREQSWGPWKAHAFSKLMMITSIVSDSCPGSPPEKWRFVLCICRCTIFGFPTYSLSIARFLRGSCAYYNHLKNHNSPFEGQVALHSKDKLPIFLIFFKRVNDLSRFNLIDCVGVKVLSLMSPTYGTRLNDWSLAIK